ncbi:MAG: hypothetical protein K2W79_12920 [Hydrotalea flava]|nr:hypothetical protein [Hydrotalea flava]
MVLTSDGRIIISDAKHSQAAALIDGDAPRFTQNQTPAYQWVVDGTASKIEVIGNKGGTVIKRGDDLLLNLDGKIRILTNDASGNIVEASVIRTKR